MSPDELWLSLRQGARNVAGVRWQVAVSVHLLIAARAGRLPFVRLIPEGNEDLDCQHADGDATLVQMKEVGAGAGRLTASDVADALAHADEALGESAVALVTDGDLGSGLLFTGWDSVLAAQGQQPTEDVVKHLVNRGLTELRAEALLQQTRLISLPWNVREETERLLTIGMGVHPAVASFAIGLLYERVGQTAADQRSATRDIAGAHTPSDVDAAVAVVQSAVDVTGLDAAVAAGVCAPANYLSPSDLSPRQFYRGVDGSPSHITAHLDVLRLREMRQIVEAAGAERYALVAGPSGSGKSVLLWRAARDAVLGARVVRVRRMETLEDVDLLARHVRLLQPTNVSPVVVAADNLGRPGMAAWPAAVDVLRELPAVVVIAACRAEDFHPALVRSGARIIEPRLDEQTSRQIADRISAAGLPRRMAAPEAYQRCDGLLMEFMALLTTGQRLEQVLAEQAAGLRKPGRELQRSAARLLTAAHSAGLSLPASQLGAVLAGGGPVEAVGDALGVLNGEHIITRDGDWWRGMHELRSQTLTALLHESPPPTLTDTYAAVARLLPAAEAGWLLRRIAESGPDRALAVAAAVAGHVNAADATAADVALLLEGAERADNAIHAQACLPILEASRRPGITISRLAIFVYGIRYQGLWPQPIGVPDFDRMLRHMRQIASRLPARASAAATAVASGLSGDRFAALAEEASLADVTRLSEAASGVMTLTAATVARILSRFTPPADTASADLYARLIEALAGHLDTAERDQALGSFRERAVSIARADPTATDVAVDEAARTVTATIMLPPHDLGAEDSQAWDAPPHGSTDQANTAAAATARRLASACPEAETIEVVTITPSGKQLKVAGHPAGYKRMSRDAFPGRTGVRRNIGFQAALGRLTAAESWTQLITRQVESAKELIDLLAVAPARLHPADNAARRRQWTDRIKAECARTSTLSSQPALAIPIPGISHARADDSGRQADKTSDALNACAQALARIVHDENRIGQASTLRDAAKQLLRAREASDPALGDIGRPVPDSLIAGVEQLARLLTAIHHDPSAARRIRGTDQGEAVASLLADARARTRERQRAILRTAVEAIPGIELHPVIDPDPLGGTVDDTAWLITAPVDSWNALVTALQELSADDRWALSCNVMAIPVDAGCALPIGVRLTHVGDLPELPMPLEMIRSFADRAGLQPPAQDLSATTIAAITDALTSTSWRIALLRRRPADWPTPPPAAVPSMDEVRVLAARTDAALPDAVKEALTVLINQVTAEADGTATNTLSGEIFDGQGLGPPPDTSAPHLWDTLSIVSATMIIAATPSAHMTTSR